MSEEETEQEREIETRLKNTKTNDEIAIKTTVENAKKLKELLDEQNSQNKQIREENERLKKEHNEKFESEFGKVGSSAPLNNQQLTGEQPEQDISSPDVNPEFWEFSEHSAMFKALQDASNDSQNPQQAEAKQILGKLIKKSHKSGGTYELQGNITELGKKNPDPKKMPYFEKIKDEE